VRWLACVISPTRLELLGVSLAFRQEPTGQGRQKRQRASFSSRYCASRPRGDQLHPSLRVYAVFCCTGTHLDVCYRGFAARAPTWVCAVRALPSVCGESSSFLALRLFAVSLSLYAHF